MNIYLVGGAVRDKLLNIESVDNDWVVVGATSEQMLNEGYVQVGKDFPVFLHPETKEEYALARTERKQGKGYTGFDTRFSPDITIEEDLIRRDLTINAMAMKGDELVDPYGGQSDLSQKLLRHVSDAFVEDPLRVLRVARFKARYHHLGFEIANETMSLLKDIVASDELAELPAERIWTETCKALNETSPQEYFTALRSCQALAKVFGEIDALFGVPQREEFHPEVDTGIHTMMVLDQAVKLGGSVEARFAALVHDLGKAKTEQDVLPRHIGHEKKSLPLIRSLCKRLKIPNYFEKLALLVAEYHTHCHQALSLKPSTVLKLLESLDVFRRPTIFDDFLLACEADARGRLGFEDKSYPQADYLRKIVNSLQQISVQEIIQSGKKGGEISLALSKQRMAMIKTIKLEAEKK